MKRFVVLFFVVFIFADLTAGSSSTDLFNSVVRKRGVPLKGGSCLNSVKVAFATPVNQVSDYWRRSITAFKLRMDEIGIPYEVHEFSTKASESRKLKESIQLALQTNPDYIVVTPNDAGDEAIISRLLANNDVKVIIQNTTRSNEEWLDTPPFLYVGFDHKLGTEKIANEYIWRFKNRASVNYAVLNFIPDSQVSRLRGDYFIELIGAHSHFNLAAEYYTRGARKRAKKSTLEILKKTPDLDFIYACNTDAAFGALDALNELDLSSEVLLNGWGGGANELRSLLDGKIDFTIMRMNDDNGVAMAEAIRHDLQSQPFPQIYSGDMNIVSSSDRWIIEALKKRSFRYSANEVK